jgi:hypothetical protein
MARLPTPGSDDGTWGDILNDFLSQEHNADGTLKNAVKTIGNQTISGVKTFEGNALFKSSVPWADITAFGADPAGVTDSTVGIQSAIDTVAVTGGKVYCPPGIYLISATIIIKSKVHLYGDSTWSVYGALSSGIPALHTAVFKLANSSNVDMVQFPSTTKNAKLEGIILSGNNTNQSSGNGIRILGDVSQPRNGNWLEKVYVSQVKETGVLIDSNAPESRLREVLILECGGEGLDIGGGDSYIDLCLVGFNGGNGINIRDTSYACNISSVDTFYNNLVGVNIGAATFVRASNIQANGNKREGIVLNGTLFSQFVQINSNNNGREFDTSAIRYSNLRLSHPTSGMNSVQFIACEFYTTDGKENYAVYDNQTLSDNRLSFTGCTFAGNYAIGTFSLTDAYDLVGCSGLGNVMQTHSTGVTGLAVRGLSGQSTNIFEVRQNTNARVFSVSNGGRAIVGGASVLNAARFVCTTSASSQIAIGAQGSAGQTADLFQAADINNVIKAGITAAGRVYANDGVTTKTKTGIPTDSDFAVTPPDGTVAVDTTNSKFYVRIGGVWKGVTLT